MSNELIARLEAAEVGSRELDAYVECASHGWHIAGWNAGWYLAEVCGAVQQMPPPFPYTTSLDAAIALAIRLFGEVAALDLLYQVLGWSKPSVRSLPIALCIAILRALDAQGQGD